MLKEEKLFSVLYVVGTALAITMTMIISIMYYIRLAPVYPETERSLTLVVKSGKLTSDEGQTSSYVSYNILNEWLYPLKGAEAVTGTFGDPSDEDDFVQPADGGEEIPAFVRCTDENFFRVFTFTFLDGAPFSKADRLSGLQKAVISDDYARLLFGSAENVVGKHISLNFTDVQIVGVVKGASFLTPVSYAQLYLPYTTVAGYEKSWSWPLGYYRAYVKVKDRDSIALVKEQVHELVRKYNTSGQKNEGQLELINQPEMYWESTFDNWSNVGVDWSSVISYFVLIFMVLLFVPALNLSGMISHRMECRLPEMGVRKAFGANRRGLLAQVMWENLLLSLLGGLLGLVLAWLSLYFSGGAVFSMLDTFPDPMPEGVKVSYGVDMLFAPTVFIIALLFCIAMNLLSALIPAIRSLRKNIVYSLNEKR